MKKIFWLGDLAAAIGIIAEVWLLFNGKPIPFELFALTMVGAFLRHLPAVTKGQINELQAALLTIAVSSAPFVAYFALSRILVLLTTSAGIGIFHFVTIFVLSGIALRVGKYESPDLYRLPIIPIALMAAFWSFYGGLVFSITTIFGLPPSQSGATIFLVFLLSFGIFTITILSCWPIAAPIHRLFGIKHEVRW